MDAKQIQILLNCMEPLTDTQAESVRGGASTEDDAKIFLKKDELVGWKQEEGIWGTDGVATPKGIWGTGGVA